VLAYLIRIPTALTSHMHYSIISRLDLQNKQAARTPQPSCILSEPVRGLKKEEGNANQLHYETVLLNSNQDTDCSHTDMHCNRQLDTV